MNSENIEPPEAPRQVAQTHGKLQQLAKRVGQATIAIMALTGATKTDKTPRNPTMETNPHHLSAEDHEREEAQSGSNHFTFGDFERAMTAGAAAAVITGMHSRASSGLSLPEQASGNQTVDFTNSDTSTGLLVRRSPEKPATKGEVGLTVTTEQDKNQDMADQDHHEHVDVDKLWKEQQAAFDAIARDGAQAHYDQLSPQKKQALFFSPEQMQYGCCSCCADEGIRHFEQNGKPMALLRSAGSGILEALNDPNYDALAPEVIDRIARHQLAKHVTVYTGHAGCGAARIIFLAHLEKNKEARRYRN